MPRGSEVCLVTMNKKCPGHQNNLMIYQGYEGLHCTTIQGSLLMMAKLIRIVGKVFFPEMRK